MLRLQWKHLFFLVFFFFNRIPQCGKSAVKKEYREDECVQRQVAYVKARYAISSQCLETMWNGKEALGKKKTRLCSFVSKWQGQCLRLKDFSAAEEPSWHQEVKRLHHDARLSLLRLWKLLSLWRYCTGTAVRKDMEARCVRGDQTPKSGNLNQIKYLQDFSLC